MKSWRRWVAVAAGLLVAVAALALAQSEPVTEVLVANWPKLYEVAGEVSVAKPIPHADFVRREGLIVTTSHRNELAELMAAGSVETGGFTSVTVSLQGEVKAATTADGNVGVLLIPDEEPVLEALRDAKKVAFAIETSCPLGKGSPAYFDGGSVTAAVAFPRYRIFLYNTAPHAVEANVYVYLKN